MGIKTPDPIKKIAIKKVSGLIDRYLDRQLRLLDNGTPEIDADVWSCMEHISNKLKKEGKIRAVSERLHEAELILKCVLEKETSKRYLKALVLTYFNSQSDNKGK